MPRPAHYILAAAALFGVLASTPALGDDPTGLHSAWMSKQYNLKKDQCCNGQDVYRVPEGDWGIKGRRYWVFFNGTTHEIDDQQLVRPTSPNPTGSALLWYGKTEDGGAFIRCFIPATES